MRYPPVPSLYAALLLPLCFLPLRAQAPPAEAFLSRHGAAFGGREPLQFHATRRLAPRIKGMTLSPSPT
ncbi:MAG: hypothetical protein HYZ13_05205 [Acidobacteria bacterium]|nr:hypothetical protein [Acidobacteriota bacterium]